MRFDFDTFSIDGPASIAAIIARNTPTTPDAQADKGMSLTVLTCHQLSFRGGSSPGSARLGSGSVLTKPKAR